MSNYDVKMTLRSLGVGRSPSLCAVSFLIVNKCYFILKKVAVPVMLFVPPYSAERLSVVGIQVST